MKNGYCVYDSFNDKIISRHHTIDSAIKARRKHATHWLCFVRQLVDGKAVRLNEIDTLYEAAIA